MSMRALSMKAGQSEGYVAGILNVGKEPTIGPLMAMCEVLKVSPAYILLGIDLDQEGLDFLQAWKKLPPEVQEAFRAAARLPK